MDELEQFIESGQESQPVQPKNKIVLIFALGVLAFILFGVGVIAIQLRKQQEIQPQTGLAPDFELALYGGGHFKLSEQKGKVVLLNFWGSWCGPCRVEAPELQELWERYQDDDFIIIGVDWLDSESNGLAFIEEFGLSYPNGADIEERVAKAYHIQGAPENFLIDKEGNIAQFLYGGVHADKLAPIIDDLLAQ